MKRSPQRKAAVRRSASSSARLQDRQRKQRRNFFLERLEDRSLMATVLWSGNQDENLANPANWVGGLPPLQDDALVFPAGATRLGTTNNPLVNNFPAGTRFRSITISSNYNIGVLGSPSITLLEGVTFNAASGQRAVVSVPLALGAAASITSANVGATLQLDPSATIDLGNAQTLTTDGKGDIEIRGIISGTSASGITKQGDGTLILMGAADNTFEGPVNINQGVLHARKSGALGSSTTAGTFVNTGAALHVSNNVTIAENFVIRDVGVGFEQTTMGSIRSVGGGNVLSGTITLGNSSSFGVDPGLNTDKLTITGQIMMVPSPTLLTSDFGFTKFGAGVLELGGGTDNVVTGQVTVQQGTLRLAKTGGADAFKGNLVIGDNRNTGPQATVTYGVAGTNQIPDANFYRAGQTGAVTVSPLNTVTVNSTGVLDLSAAGTASSGQGDSIGNLVLVNGRSSSAQVITGSSRLILTGDITVNPTEGSSFVSAVATPPSRITGNLHLGKPFSGTGGGTQHTITINDTVTPNIAAGLVIEATISSVSVPADPTIDGGSVPLTKAGTGTLLLAGNNTYTGPTRITQGIVDVSTGSTSPFGNANATVTEAGTTRRTNLVSVAGNAGIRAVDLATLSSTAGNAYQINNDISLDANLTVFGARNIIFNGDMTMTGTRSITVMDPAQITEIKGNLGETTHLGTVAGLTKLGRGTLELDPSATKSISYTGPTVIGGTTQDGGTLRLAGTAALAQPAVGTTAITVSQGATLELAAGTVDRVPDAQPITMTGGTIRVIGTVANTPTETLGPITMTGNWSNRIVAENARVTLNGMTRGGGSTMNFEGVGNPLGFQSGDFSQIRFAKELNSPNQTLISQIPALSSGILPWAVITSPGASAGQFNLDFATYTSGPDGMAVTAVPQTAYVTDFNQVPEGQTDALVKLSSNQSPPPTVNLPGSRTILGLIMDAGNLGSTGSDPASTLTVTSGLVAFNRNASLTVSNLSLGGQGTIFTAAGAAVGGEIRSSITGNGTDSITKAGPGTLILSGGSQFTGQLNVNEGAVRATHAQALGSPSGSTLVNNGAQLQFDMAGTTPIVGEPVTLIGTGPVFRTDSVTGTTVASNLTITGIAPNTNNIVPGMRVTGFGIPANAVVTAVPSVNSVTLSVAPTAPNTVQINGNIAAGGDIITLVSANTTIVVGMRVTGPAQIQANTVVTQVISNTQVRISSTVTPAVNNQPLTFTETTPLTFTTHDGALFVLPGASPRWTSLPNPNNVLTLTGATTVDGTAFFKNSANTTLNASAINVGAGATLDLSGVMTSAAGTDLVKLGTGELQLSGSLPNTLSATSTVRIKQGTVHLNKLPPVGQVTSSGGVNALGNTFQTIVVGDDTSGSATLKFGAANQLAQPAAPVAQTGLTVANNTTISAIPTTAGILPGMLVTGPGIVANTTVVSVAATSVVLSTAASVTVSLPVPLVFSGTPTTIAGNVTQASNVITGLISTANITVGGPITGTGIPANTTVTAILSGSSIQISANATAGNNGVTLTVHGAGGQSLLVATNGVVDMDDGDDRDQVIGNLTMQAGGTLNDAAEVHLGRNTLALTGNITVQAQGTLTSQGAMITGTAGGTIALNAFNSTSGVTRQIRVDETGAVNVDALEGNTASDLIISASIVDGTGFAASGLTKTGLGGLELSGGGANTYTGTTTVADGALVLNKGISLTGTTGIGSTTISGFTAAQIANLSVGMVVTGPGISTVAPVTITAVGANSVTMSAAGVAPAGANLLRFVGGNAMSGPLVIGDGGLGGNTRSGYARSDVVRLAQNDQLPDFQGGVTVGGTGWLDLAGKNESLGTADGAVGLIVNGGIVDTGVGTLTLNGNVRLASSTLTLTGNTALNSTTIAGLATTANLAVGMPVLGLNLLPGTTIASIVNATSITVSTAATAAATGVQLFFGTTAGAVVPAQLNTDPTLGNVVFPGGIERRVEVVDSPSLQSDANISARLNSTGDFLTTGSGTITMSGNNTLTGGVSIQNTGNLGQPSVLLGSTTALGTGIQVWASTASVSANVAGFALPAATRVLTNGGFALAAGNDLTISGPMDLQANSAFNVGIGSTLTLSGGVGEMNTGRQLTKNGGGTLVIDSLATFSGNLVINAGTVIVKGNGALPNVNGITIAAGASLVIDNSLSTGKRDRINNNATVTLNGGNLTHIGGTAESEEVFNQLSTGNDTGTSTLTQVAGTGPENTTAGNTTMRFAQLNRGNNSFLSVTGVKAMLGTTNKNRIIVDRAVAMTGPTSTQLLGLNTTAAPTAAQILNWGVLNTVSPTGVSDIDFLNVDPLLGITKAITAENTITNNGNVKLTSGITTLPAEVLATGDLRDGEAVINNLSTTAGLQVGIGVFGEGISGTVVSISANSVTVSVNATRTATGVPLRFGIGNVNGVLFRGSGLTLTSNAVLRVVGGLIAAVGDNNAINGTGTVVLNGLTSTVPGLLVAPNYVAPNSSTTALTINSQIGATIGVTKLGLGRINLAGANRYEGQTNVTEGVLRVSNHSALGINDSTIAASTMTQGATLPPTGITGTTAASSPTITAVTSTAGLQIGMGVSGPGILPNTTVTGFTANTVTIAPAAGPTGTGTGAITFSITGTTTQNSNVVTGVTVTAGIQLGMVVTGPGVPLGATVTGVLTGATPAQNTVTLSANVGAGAGTGPMTFAVNESHALVFGPNTTISGGTFTLTLVTPDGVARTTAPITWDANSATLQARIQRELDVILAPITGGTATVTVRGGNFPTGGRTTAGSNVITHLTGAANAGNLNIGMRIGDSRAIPDGATVTGINAFNTPGSTTEGSFNVTMASLAGITVGMAFSGTGIPISSTVSVINTATNTITFTNARNESATVTSTAPVTLSFINEITISAPATLTTTANSTFSMAFAGTRFAVTFGGTLAGQNMQPMSVTSLLTNQNVVVGSGRALELAPVPAVVPTGGAIANNTSTITGLSSTADIRVGMTVTASGVGLPANTVVRSILSPTSVTISSNVTPAQSGLTYTFSGTSISKDLNISGTGIANTGALRNVSGPNFVSGNLTQTGAGTSIGVDSGSTLTLGGTGAVIGTVGLTKVGTGTLELGGTASSNFTGNVNINEGTLRLNKNLQAAVQRLTLNGGANGQTFFLTYGGAAPVPVTYSTTANTLRDNINAALITLFGTTTVGNNQVANASVPAGTAIPNGVVTTITFAQALAGSPVGLLGVIPGSLSAGTAPTGTLAVGSNVITAASSVTGLVAGMPISGAGIPAGTTIVSTTSSPNTITMSNPASQAGTAVGLSFIGITPVTPLVTNPGAILTGNTTNNSASITALPSTTGLRIGTPVSGAGIPANAFIVTVDSATAITISANATATATGVSLTFGAGFNVITTGSGNEVQRLTFSPNITGGLFQIRFPLATGNVDTPALATPGSAISYNTNASLLAANIQAVADSVLTAGRVKVVANSATEIDFFFGGTGRDSLRGNVGTISVLANSFTGNNLPNPPVTPTTVVEGVQGLGGLTINVGDSVGASNADQLVLADNDQITDTGSNLTVRSSGRFEMGVFTETLQNALRVESGLTGAASVVATGAPAAAFLTLPGGITTQLQAGTSGGLTAPSVGPRMEIGAGAARTWVLADSIGTVDLSVPSILTNTTLGSSNAGQQLNITGSGRVDLSGASTFTGAISVQGATILRASSHGALGGTGGGVTFGRNEVQAITRNTAVPGKILFGFNSVFSEIEFEYTADTLLSDLLDNLNSIPELTDNFELTGPEPGGPYTVTFAGGLGGADVPTLTATTNTPGVSIPTFAVPTPGIAAAGSLELNASIPDVQVTGTTTSGVGADNRIINMSSTAGLGVGQFVTGPGMPNGVQVTAVNGAISITNVTTTTNTDIPNSGQTVTNLGNTTNLVVGMTVGGTNIGAGSTITGIFPAQTISSGLTNTAGSPTISGFNPALLTGTTQTIFIGMVVSGTGIPAGTKISSLGANSITLTSGTTTNVASVTFTNSVRVSNPSTTTATNSSLTTAQGSVVLSANATPAVGSTLTFIGITTAEGGIFLQGVGYAGRGVLQAVGGDQDQAIMTGALGRLPNNAVVGVDPGVNLRLQGSLDFGLRTMVKMLPGELTIAGGGTDNAAVGSIGSATGGLTVAEGSVRLARTNASADTGALNSGLVTVGNDLGGQDADQLIFEGNNQIGPAASVAVSSTGLLNMQTFSDTLGNTQDSLPSTTFTGTLAQNNALITGVSPNPLTNGVRVGMYITAIPVGTNVNAIPLNAFVIAVTSNEIRMSANTPNAGTSVQGGVNAPTLIFSHPTTLTPLSLNTGLANSGRIAGTGTLTVTTMPGGGMNTTASATSLGNVSLVNSPPARIEVPVNLGGGRRTVNVGAAGSASNVLQISGNITSGQLEKAGAGTLTLSATQNNLTAVNETQTLTLGGTSGGTYLPVYRGVQGLGPALPVVHEQQLLTITGGGGGLVRLTYDTQQGDQATAITTGRNEDQTISVGSSPVTNTIPSGVGGEQGGKFTLSYNGQVHPNADELSLDERQRINASGIGGTGGPTKLSYGGFEADSFVNYINETQVFTAVGTGTLTARFNNNNATNLLVFANEVQTMTLISNSASGNTVLSYNGVQGTSPLTITTGTSGTTATQVQDHLRSNAALSGNEVQLITAAGTGDTRLSFAGQTATSDLTGFANEQRRLSVVGGVGGNVTTRLSFNGVSATGDLTFANEVQTLRFAAGSFGTSRLSYNGVEANADIAWANEVQILRRVADGTTRLAFSLTGLDADRNFANAPLLLDENTKATDVQANLRSIPILDGNEIQTLSILSPGPTLLQFNGVDAETELDFVAGVTTLEEIQLHLESIPALNGNVVVSQRDPDNNTGEFRITFVGNLAAGNRATIVSNAPEAVSIDTLIDGSPAVVTVSGLAGGPFTITFGGGLAGQNATQIFSEDSDVGEIVHNNPGQNAVDGTAPTAAQLQAILKSIPMLSGNEVQVLTVNNGGALRLTLDGAAATTDLNYTAEVQTVKLNGEGVVRLAYDDGSPAGSVEATSDLTVVNEVQTVTALQQANGVTLSYDGLVAPGPGNTVDTIDLIPGASGTTTTELQDYLRSIPGLNGNEVQRLTLAADGPTMLSYVRPDGTLSNATSALEVSLGGTNTAGNIVRAGNVTPNSTVLTFLSTTADLRVGMTVTGAGIGPNTVITGIPTSNSVTINNPGNSTATTTNLTFGAPGRGMTESVVQRNLELIPELQGKVTVKGNPGGPFNIEFRGPFVGHGHDIPQLVSTPISGGAKANMSTVINGSGAPAVSVSGNQGGQFTVSYSGALTGVNATQLASSNLTVLTATATPGSAPNNTAVQNHLRTIPALAAVTVAGAAPSYTVTFAGALTGQDADLISSNNASVATTALVTDGSAPSLGQVTAALESLTVIPGSVLVAGGPTDPINPTNLYSITFTGGLAQRDVNQITPIAPIRAAGNIDLNSNLITGLASTANISLGMTVSGTGILAGTTVIASQGGDPANSIRVSRNATVTANNVALVITAPNIATTSTRVDGLTTNVLTTTVNLVGTTSITVPATEVTKITVGMGVRQLGGSSIPSGATVTAVNTATNVVTLSAATGTATGAVIEFAGPAIALNATGNLSRNPDNALDPNNFIIRNLPAASVARIRVGMDVSHVGGSAIPAGTVVTAVNTTLNTVTISAPATATVSGASLLFVPGVVSVSGPLGGPYTITYGGGLAGTNASLITTSNSDVILAETNGSAPTIAQLEANLRTIQQLNAQNGAVVVSGGAPNYTITFAGTLAGLDIPDATTINSSIQAPATASPVASATAELRDGAAPSLTAVQDNLRTIPLLSGNEVQTLTLLQNGPVTFTFGGGANPSTTINVVTGTVGTSALELETQLGLITDLTGNVSVSGPQGGPFNIQFVNARKETNHPEIAITAATKAQATISTAVDGGAGTPAITVQRGPNTGSFAPFAPSPDFAVVFGGALGLKNVEGLVTSGTPGTAGTSLLVDGPRAVVATGTVTGGSEAVTFTSTPVGLLVGMQVIGANIPPNTTVVAINTTTNTVRLSNVATGAASASTTLTFLDPVVVVNTSVLNGNTTNASAVVNNVAVTGQQGGTAFSTRTGMAIGGAGIPNGTTVAQAIAGFNSAANTITNNSGSRTITSFNNANIGNIIPGMTITGTGVPGSATVSTVVPAFSPTGLTVTAANPAEISGFTDTQMGNITVGMAVSGTGVPANTFVVAVTAPPSTTFANNKVTLSNPVTPSITTITFANSITISANTTANVTAVTFANTYRLSAPATATATAVPMVLVDKWDPLESTCRHASLSIL